MYQEKFDGKFNNGITSSIIKVKKSDENKFNVISPLHDITFEKSRQEGISFKKFWNKFLCEKIKNADYIVGHNILFDLHIIASQLCREENKEKYMDGYDNVMNIINTNKYLCTINLAKKYRAKKMSLNTLYKEIFNKDIENQHRVKSDIKAINDIIEKICQTDLEKHFKLLCDDMCECDEHNYKNMFLCEKKMRDCLCDHHKTFCKKTIDLTDGKSYSYDDIGDDGEEGEDYIGYGAPTINIKLFPCNECKIINILKYSIGHHGDGEYDDDIKKCNCICCENKLNDVLYECSFLLGDTEHSGKFNCKSCKKPF